MLSLALCRVPRAGRTNACQCGSEQRSAHRIAACTVIRRVRRQSYACWVIWTIALTLWRAGSAHSTGPDRRPTRLHGRFPPTRDTVPHGILCRRSYAGDTRRAQPSPPDRTGSRILLRDSVAMDKLEEERQERAGAAFFEVLQT